MLLVGHGIKVKQESQSDLQCLDTHAILHWLWEARYSPISLGPACGTFNFVV